EKTDAYAQLGVRLRIINCKIQLPGGYQRPWGLNPARQSLLRRCSPRARAVKAARALFLSNPAAERVELLWIVSTYLVGKNESENQKGNLSYLAGTKKRSDSLMQ